MTVIDNRTLDEWWVAQLERNQVTDRRIEFYARVELPTGETVRIPLDTLTDTKCIETDVFGTKPASNPSNSQPDGEITPTHTPPSASDGSVNSPSSGGTGHGHGDRNTLHRGSDADRNG